MRNNFPLRKIRRCEIIEKTKKKVGINSNFESTNLYIKEFSSPFENARSTTVAYNSSISKYFWIRRWSPDRQGRTREITSTRRNAKPQDFDESDPEASLGKNSFPTRREKFLRTISLTRIKLSRDNFDDRSIRWSVRERAWNKSQLYLAY